GERSGEKQWAIKGCFFAGCIAPAVHCFGGKPSVRRTAALSLLLILLTASIGSAQEWARKMFSDTSHDFGKVAKGAKVQHRFKFKNIYEEPIHVASVRSSCGCTSVDITKRDLKTWETSEVIANFNTNAFLGHHSA